MLVCTTAEANLKEATKDLQQTIQVERQAAERWRQELLALKSRSPQHEATGSRSASKDTPVHKQAPSSRSPATGKVSQARPETPTRASLSPPAQASKAASPLANLSSSSKASSAAQSGGAGGDVARSGDGVEVTLRLGIDARQAGMDGSTQRAAFKIKMTQDLHRASGLPTKCFVLESFDPAPPREVGESAANDGSACGGLDVRLMVLPLDSDNKTSAEPGRSPADVVSGTASSL
jgi:hypothetical protein